MSTHFWFGGDDVPYLVKESTRFDEASLNRAPKEDDPYQYGETAEISSVTVETAGGLTTVTPFKPVTYQGNGTSQDISCGFSPDLVWVKSRTYTYQHVLTNSVSGTSKYLSSQGNSAEENGETRISSLNVGGFSVGNSVDTNSSGTEYVAWCWDAGGGTVTNNEGTIQSQVRSNGNFSVVSYTGVGTTGVLAGTVGHGLNNPPSMILLKDTTISGDWKVLHVGANDGSDLYYENTIHLNSTSSFIGTGNVFPWGGVEPTNTIFSVGNNGTQDRFSGALSGVGYIAFCWCESPTQNFGSYTGDGSASGPDTGPVIDCGFEPAFVMIKNVSGTGGWVMFDTVRTSNDPNNVSVEAQASDVEVVYSPRQISFTSTGFEVSGADFMINTSGQTYIYAAFAESYIEDNRVETSTLQFNTPTSLDTDLKTELFAAGEIVYQDSAYAALSDNISAVTVNGPEYEIANSLLFNGVDTYLDRTPAVSGNRRTWTWSGWVKKSGSDKNMTMFGSDAAGNNTVTLGYSSDNRLRFQVVISGTNTYIDTVGTFDDSSDWYHVVLAFDSTQSVATNRTKIYVDGVVQLVTGSYCAQNADGVMNSTSAMNIGQSGESGANYYLDSYLSDVQFVDGLALSALDFGKYDDNDKWIAKEFLTSASTSAITNVSTTPGWNVISPNSVSANLYGSAGSDKNNVLDSDITDFISIASPDYGTYAWDCGLSSNPVPINSSLQVYVQSLDASPNQIRITVNETVVSYINIENRVDTLVNVPFTGQSQLSNFRIDAAAGGGWNCYLYYIVVDGKVLTVDSNFSTVNPEFVYTNLTLTNDTNLDNIFVGDTVDNGGSFTRTVYSGYSGLHIDSVAVDASPENDLEVIAALKDLPIVVGSQLWGSTYPPYLMYISDTTTFEFTKPGVYTIYFTSQSNDSGTEGTVTYGTGASGPASFTSTKTTDGGAPVEFTITQDNATIDITGALGISSWSGGTDGKVSSVDSTSNTLTLGSVNGTWSNGDIATKNTPYGTNGFHLDFSTSSLGVDSSGQGNNFSPEGFAFITTAGDNYNLSTLQTSALTETGQGNPGNLFIDKAGQGFSLGKSNNTVPNGYYSITYYDSWPAGTYTVIWNTGGENSCMMMNFTYNIGDGDVTPSGWSNGTQFQSSSFTFTASEPFTELTFSALGGNACSGTGNSANATLMIQSISLNGGMILSSALTPTVVDSPTPYGFDTGLGGEVRGNYATINPLTIPGNTEYTNGNLTIIKNATQHAPNYANIGVASGKFYWEITKTTNTLDGGYLMGLVAGSELGNVTDTSGPNRFIVYHQASTVYYYDGTPSPATGYFTSGSTNNVDPGVFMLAFDADNGELYVGKDGNWYTTTSITGGDPANGVGPILSQFVSGTTYFPVISGYNAGQNFNLNFGQRPFVHQAPEGFKALNTLNMAS